MHISSISICIHRIVNYQIILKMKRIYTIWFCSWIFIVFIINVQKLSINRLYNDFKLCWIRTFPNARWILLFIIIIRIPTCILFPFSLKDLLFYFRNDDNSIEEYLITKIDGTGQKIRDLNIDESPSRMSLSSRTKKSLFSSLIEYQFIYLLCKMAKSTPTSHACFIRHADGRQVEATHRIILRRVFFDMADQKTKEETLFDILLDKIPSFFFLSKEQFEELGPGYEVKATAYVLDDTNYVMMIAVNYITIRDSSVLINVKVKGKKNSFLFLKLIKHIF